MLNVLISISLYILITSLIAIMGHIDYLRVKNGKKPIFTNSGDAYTDGGSVKYYGLCYSIMSNHSFSKAPRPEWARSNVWAYDIGPEITFIPYVCPWWKNRSEVKTVIDETRKREWENNK